MTCLLGPITRDFTQTPVTLFRFSALTFNGHKIHYSVPWCREVEGHRNLVVHGPLNLVNMLDFWRDTRKEANTLLPRSIKYRATSPLYADETYRSVMEEIGDEKTTIQRLVGMDGKLAMEAEIVAF